MGHSSQLPNYLNLFLKINFVLANSTCSGEMSLCDISYRYSLFAIVSGPQMVWPTTTLVIICLQRHRPR